MIKVIGLTGGPGAGKSLAAGYLKEGGAIVISGDEAGRAVLAKYPLTLEKLSKAFGASILADNGSLDRKKLGRIVFSDPKAMKKLNKIVHPYLLKILRSEIRGWKTRQSRNLIVVDAALIYEWGIEKWFDLILVVRAKRDNRIKRLKDAGLTRKEAEDRIRSQISQRSKASRADFVIDNDTSKSDLRRKIAEFLLEAGRRI